MDKVGENARRAALPASVGDRKSSMWGRYGHGRVGPGMPESAPCSWQLPGSAGGRAGQGARSARAAKPRS